MEDTEKVCNTTSARDTTSFPHDAPLSPSLRCAGEMSINERLVSVDKADPSIKWEGPWVSVEGNTDDLGNYGPPFLGTLQGTSSGSFSFSFRGISAQLRHINMSA